MNRALLFFGTFLIAAGIYAFVPETSTSNNSSLSIPLSIGEITRSSESIPLNLQSNASEQFDINASSQGLLDFEPVDQAVKTSQTGLYDPLKTLERQIDDQLALEEYIGSGSVSGASSNSVEYKPVFTEIEAVVDSTLYQAARQAGITSNQMARINKLLSPFIDFQKESRQGDRLIVTLNQQMEAANDADRILEVLFQGVKKTLVVARNGQSLNSDNILSSYVVLDGKGDQAIALQLPKTEIKPELIETQESAKKPDVIVAKAETPKVKQRSIIKSKSDSGLKTVEGVVEFSFLGAARGTGLDKKHIADLSNLFKPYLDFSNDLRKGDRLIVNLDKNGDRIHSAKYLGLKKRLVVKRDSKDLFVMTDTHGKTLVPAVSDPGPAKKKALVAKKTPKKPASVKVAASPSKIPTKTKVVTKSKSKPDTKKVATKSKKRTEKTVAKSTTNKSSEKKKSSLLSVFSQSDKTPGWVPKDRKIAKIYREVYRSGQVNRQALEKAFKYYERHRNKKSLSQTHIGIADYTRTAFEKRMHVINLKTGIINSYQVAHGKKSGPVGGRVYSTSNRVSSHMTSEGFFKIGYQEGITLQKRYDYLPITGLENANQKVGLPTRMGGRDVVLHTAKYVANGGRSFGCFAIRPQDKRPVFDKLKGALLFSYAG